MDTIKMKREAFGKELQNQRLKRKMSVEDLANAANLTESTIIRLESGRYSADFDLLSRIAEALNKSIGFQ